MLTAAPQRLWLTPLPYICTKSVRAGGRPREDLAPIHYILFTPKYHNHEELPQTACGSFLSTEAVLFSIPTSTQPMEDRSSIFRIAYPSLLAETTNETEMWIDPDASTNSHTNSVNQIRPNRRQNNLTSYRKDLENPSPYAW